MTWDDELAAASEEERTLYRQHIRSITTAWQERASSDPRAVVECLFCDADANKHARIAGEWTPICNSLDCRDAALSGRRLDTPRRRLDRHL